MSPVINVYFSQTVNIEDAESKRRRQRQQEERERNNEGGQQRFGMKRATDDYHYDKFRKQFRRYWKLFTFSLLWFCV